MGPFTRGTISATGMSYVCCLERVMYKQCIMYSPPHVSILKEWPLFHLRRHISQFFSMTCCDRDVHGWGLCGVGVVWVMFFEL